MIGCLSPLETYMRVNRKKGFALQLVLLEHISFIDRLILALKYPYISLCINLFIHEYTLFFLCRHSLSWQLTKLTYTWIFNVFDIRRAIKISGKAAFREAGVGPRSRATQLEKKGENPNGRSHASLELEHRSSEFCFKIQYIFSCSLAMFFTEPLVLFVSIIMFYTLKSKISKIRNPSKLLVSSVINS